MEWLCLLLSGSHSLRHRDKEVCLPISPPYSIYLSFEELVDTNVSTTSIPCKHFNKKAEFLPK